jgi:hypothetical protein
VTQALNSQYNWGGAITARPRKTFITDAVSGVMATTKAYLSRSKAATQERRDQLKIGSPPAE